MWDLDRYENSIALIGDDGAVLSYRDLIIECNKLYENIGRRCLVFCMCSNTVGSVMGYVSFVQNGVVPVLLNSGIDKELLDNLLMLYKPSYIWMPVDMDDSLTNDENKTVYESHGYRLIKTSYDKEYELNESLCLLLTTSGSTGSPKFVRQSYKNVLSNAESIAEYLDLSSEEKPISTLPMNYTYGLSIINSHLLVGATLLMTDKSIMQKEFWNFFKEHDATSFGGVPYTYEILDKLRFYRMELPSLRYMTQAGGKITVELHRKFAEYAESHNKRFIVMYGQCEATARMGYLPYDRALEKIGSMGIAIPGGCFTLIDENGEEIYEAGTEGELVYRGANVTLGYAEKGEDLQMGDERKGVLQTGDMAKFDEDGYYYIVGRKKRFLKIFGNRVNLDEVERLIKGHFERLDIACSGVDDHMKIFISGSELKEDAEMRLKTEENVKRFVSGKTGLNPSAFQVVTLDAIPKNDSGKTLYKALMDL